MTCKIAQHTDGHHTTLRLIGHVQAAYLKMVQRQLESHGPRTVLDLDAVTLVDVEVVRFLGRCEQAGTALLHCPPSVREWIAREQQRERTQPHPHMEQTSDHDHLHRQPHRPAVVDPSNDCMSAGGTCDEATRETAAAVGIYDTRRTNPWMRAAMARTERIAGMQTLLARGGQTRSGAHERARRRDARRRGPAAPSRRAS